MKTRDVIVQTATRLFADDGYDGVTVREICAAAKVNVALVNYHFRNKEGLYRECVERLFHKAVGTSSGKLAQSVRDAKSWREAIRAWITGFATVMHAREGDMALAWHIYRHEVVHASAMHEFILLNYTRPLRRDLMTLIRMTGLDESDAFRWAASVWTLLSAHAVVDPVWRDEFRPTETDPSKWSASFIDFICERIFRELKYHGRAH